MWDKFGRPTTEICQRTEWKFGGASDATDKVLKTLQAELKQTVKTEKALAKRRREQHFRITQGADHWKQWQIVYLAKRLETEDIRAAPSEIMGIWAYTDSSVPQL